MDCEEDDMPECVRYWDYVAGDEMIEEEPCCLDMTPECMACEEGVSVPKYCRTNQDFEGCDEVYDCMHDKSCVAMEEYFFGWGMASC